MIDIFYNMRLAAASSFNQAGLLPRNTRPYLANIKLTENCNSRCITCDYWRTKSKQLISTKRAKLLLRELKKAGIKNIRLTGGEPLLREDLFDILDTCSNDWFDRVVLATNGLLLSRFAEKINKSIITNVTVSLDGGGERNDRIRGIKGYYDKVVNALPSIHRKIKIVSTFSNELLPDLEELLRYCKEQGYAYDINLLDKQMYFFSSKEVCKTIDELWP